MGTGARWTAPGNRERGTGNGKGRTVPAFRSFRSPFPAPRSLRATRVHGFTLLEVLASLALLGLLMLGVYAGVGIATRSVHAGTARVERLDEVRAAQQLLRRELAQAMAQTIDHDDRGVPLVFEGAPRQMRYVAPLPGYLGALGPQLQTLRLADDGDNGLRLELGLALLPPDGSQAQPVGKPQLLVDHVRWARFSYRGVDARGRATPWLARWTDGRTLPRLVRVELQLDGQVPWPTLEVPLRVDAGTGGSTSLLPMRRAGTL